MSRHSHSLFDFNQTAQEYLDISFMRLTVLFVSIRVVNIDEILMTAIQNA